MRFNVGTPDRMIRIILGIVLILLPFLSGLAIFASPFWVTASMAVGAVLVVTALVRFCPLYAALGISTCKVS